MVSNVLQSRGTSQQKAILQKPKASPVIGGGTCLSQRCPEAGRGEKTRDVGVRVGCCDEVGSPALSEEVAMAKFLCGCPERSDGQNTFFPSRAKSPFLGEIPL